MSAEPTSTEIVVPTMDPKKAAKPGVGEALDLQDKEVTARIISKWLDELIRIPGTDFKIGLDPIIDFVPGIGDFLSSSVSLVVIIEAIRTGVSPSVVLRMVGNMAANALIGAVPGIGPFFSAFFKSNKRNLGLLSKWHEGNQHEIQTKSRWMLFIWVLILFLALSTVLLIWAFYIWSILQIGQKIGGWLS
jgi:hypothetical protein